MTDEVRDTQIGRIDAILRELVALDCRPKSASAIASGCSLPLSTIVRQLTAMESLGWVAREGDNYVIGHNIIAISRAYFLGMAKAARRLALDIQSIEQRAHEMNEKGE